MILAGGKGKRMASVALHKVCFPIAGKAAIVRAIDTYKAAGIKRFVVVVGQMANQVIATIAHAHPEVTFVFQEDPRGTGHAAMIAAEALASQNYTGPVMITMGDKVTRPVTVHNLLERYQNSEPDALLSTLEKTKESSAGRVVLGPRGEVLGIVEVADIEKARKKKSKLKIENRQMSAEQLEKNSNSVNASMYMFDFEALHKSLGQLKSNNAQGELYLTDTIEIIARTGRVEVSEISNPEDLMAYNTPAELMGIEEVVRKREKPPRVSSLSRKKTTRRYLKTGSEWLKVIESKSPKWKSLLKRTYGDDDALIGERVKNMKRVVGAFIKRHGSKRQMILCRAPGRVNLMGRHVDHRGGFVNVMAISREVLLAASGREDDIVTLHNIKPKNFPKREFSISSLLKEVSWADWIDFVDSTPVRGILETSHGDWAHYARAPLLRLQHECSDVQLRGMDCVVCGNIPMGAGLSSSSALVVAFAEASLALNGLNAETPDFIDLCGEGEWFVGSRGGSADHAAIRTGKFGHVSRLGFYPFRLEGQVRFPSQMRVVIAHSGSQAVKSAGAKDVFNQRVACYEAAEMLMRKFWPAAAGIEHLRDLIPGRLGVKTGEVYRALAKLPQNATRNQLRNLFGKEGQKRLEQLFSSHCNVGKYDLRGVALYGLSEIARSEKFAEVIQSGQLDQIAEFMRSSHDGDRVVKFDGDLKPRKFNANLNDNSLEQLAACNAPLENQCGRYACSTEAIDQLVDISEATEGVVGAQLAGAGLGGCMMVLVHADALNLLKRQLRRKFYEPRNLAFNAHICTPVAGAGLIGI